MNTKTRIGGFILLLLLSGIAWAEELSRPHISVYGYAKTEVVPDEMLWALNVGNQGADLKTVSAEHTKIVKAVLKLIAQQGVDKKETQTSGMRFGENYVYRNNSRVKEGYIANTTISFKMNDFGKYEALWLALSKVDAVSVNGVSYDYSKRIEAQNETRIKALMAAKEKAKAMAAAMNLELGETLSIVEEQGGYDVVATNKMEMAMFDARMQEPGSPVSPGTITIEMRVQLVSALISK